ncbi:MAG TPA: VOC family protein [Candidatus Dormibacteraeota bacterium]|nr:VOC family protein [Candidatus Dormibacteraeota bacterium]
MSATIPASDLASARKFYEEKLGLTPVPEMAGIRYECGKGTGFLLFQSAGGASGAHTQLAFDVADVDAEIGRLRDNGIKFEDYDFPGLKTEKGIAEIDGGRGGWFKDPEGNLVAVFQLASVPATSG